jgi:hypothetical protein
MSPKAVTRVENLTRAVGSVGSLAVHTIVFFIAFVLGVLGISDWDSILLILTTVVSLEAIYLAIFIQMSVNQNTASLREVEVDVDEIQKDIDAIEQDVDEIQEGDAVEKLRADLHRQELQGISDRLQKLLEDINKINQ